MQIKAQCQYCGVVEYVHVKYEYLLNQFRCAYCNHDKLDFTRFNEQDKIDYYDGCPPFPKKEEINQLHTPSTQYDYEPGPEDETEEYVDIFKPWNTTGD